MLFLLLLLWLFKDVLFKDTKHEQCLVFIWFMISADITAPPPVYIGIGLIIKIS